MANDMVFKTADIGYGYVKYEDVNGNVVKTKAVVGLLGESLNPGESKNVDIIEVEGTQYLVGGDVYKLGRKPITANESVNRVDNVAYKVLSLYTLAKSHTNQSADITYLTGLPFQNFDEGDKIKELLEKAHNIRLNGREMTLNVTKVIVVSQGLGSFYSLVNQRGSAVLLKKVLLVDLGFRTINYVPVNNGDIDVDTVKTNRDLGIQNAYKRIADAVNIDFKGNFKFYDVDDLLDRGVPVQNVDKGVVYVKITEKPYVIDALSEYAGDVWADLVDKYDETYRDTLEEVIFTGGTADRVRPYLESIRKHYCSFVENSQDVQVLGYNEIARKLEKQGIK